MKLIRSIHIAGFLSIGLVAIGFLFINFTELSGSIRISKHLLTIVLGAIIGSLTLLYILFNYRKLTFSKFDLLPSAFLLICLFNTRHSKPFFDEKLPWFIACFSIYFFILLALRLGYKKHVGLLIVPILLSGILQAFYGLLQLYKVMPSHFSGHITGSFFNPSLLGAYLAAILPLAVVYSMWLPFKFETQRLKVWLICSLSIMATGLIIITLPSTFSRASWLSAAAGVGVVYILSSKGQQFISKIRSYKYFKLITLSGLILILVLLSGIYFLKKDSADGRLLTWKVSAQMIKEKPIFGHGFNRFGADYLKYQTAYFESGKGSINEGMLAGNIHWAFNEPLQILVELGAVGISIFLLWMVRSVVNKSNLRKNRFKRGMLGMLISILIFSLFSYPFYSPAIYLLFVISLAVLNGDKSKTGDLPKALKLLVTLFILVVSLACIYSASLLPQRYKAYWSWDEANKLYQIEAYAEANISFKEAYPHLQNNGKFLLNYAKSLHFDSAFVEAKYRFLEAENHYTDVVLYTSMGDNSKALGEFEMAEIYYIKASHLIPHKFFPKYQLAKMYFELEQIEKATVLANELLNKKVKVPSTAINEMLEEMQRIINSNDNDYVQ